jgi:hypothetical protein
MAHKRTVEAPSETSTVKPLLEIPEDEQLRIIANSGILHKVTGDVDASEPPLLGIREEEKPSLGDEIFNAVLLIIPFSFCLLMMEMCVRLQLYLCVVS